MALRPRPLPPTSTITTLCPLLDDYLGGGVACASVTELCGAIKRARCNWPPRTPPPPP